MTGGDELRHPSRNFTEVFVEQLVQAVVAIPSQVAGGVTIDGLTLILQSRLPGGRRSVQQLLSCLSAMNLISENDGFVGRSAAGDRLRRELRANGSTALAVAVISSGLMADQIRSLRAVLRIDGDGYVCARGAAVVGAPQLVGLLGRLPDVSVSGQISIGREAGLLLDSIWNELPPSSRVDWQDVEKRRKALGDRAEVYSLQLESTAFPGARAGVTWVSRDDDSLGYDIEVAGPPRRCIEVKGSSRRDVSFILSTNELAVARRLGTAYEIQYWGQINVMHEPMREYERLISLGYPICIRDPAAALDSEPWFMEPSQYRIRYNGSPDVLLAPRIAP